MNLVSTKIVALFLLGFLPFLAGITALPLRKFLNLNKKEANKNQKVISSLLLCFGAGILMATSLLHILPESREGMLKEQESLEIECLAELVLCSGFFLVYFLECLIHEVVGHSSNNNLAKFHSHESHDSVQEMVSSSSNHTSSNSSTSWIRNIVTAIALASHCLLEGLAVGVEESTTGVWALFIAICVHKVVIVFCISLELIKSLLRTSSFLFALTGFCCMTPLGVGIGIGILEAPSGEYHEFVVSFLQALCGGSIIYCVMFEIIQREKQKDVSGLLQLLGIILGFVGMLLLVVYVKEPEEDDDGANNSTTPAASGVQLKYLY